MKKITLGQLLQYADPQTEPEIDIQIVAPEDNWDCAVQLWVGSSLLKPFMDYIVTEIGYEENYFTKDPLIRVAIKKNEETDDA